MMSIARPTNLSSWFFDVSEARSGELEERTIFEEMSVKSLISSE